MADRIVDVLATAEPLVLSVSGGSGGVTGLSPTVALRDAATTNSYLDFNDNTFKTSGWTTKYASMTEVERGHYQRALNVSTLPSVAAGKVYAAEYRVAEGSTFIDVHDVLTVTAIVDVVEAGFDYRRALRIIAAATAGKVSGAPSAPVFRDLLDANDMVTGAADASGNRTTAMYAT